MNENKMCPLLAIAKGGQLGPVLCPGDTCAWYDAGAARCAVVEIADELTGITDAINSGN